MGYTGIDTPDGTAGVAVAAQEPITAPSGDWLHVIMQWWWTNWLQAPVRLEK